MRAVIRVFTLLLLIFVGVAFVSGPAKLMFAMTGFSLPFWLALIFIYYILATLLPIDKIIGYLYPFFGAALFFMAFGVFAGIIVNWAGGSLTLMELTPSTLRNFQSRLLIKLTFSFPLYCRLLRGHFWLPWHTVTSDGKVHKIREAGTADLLWCNGG